MGIPDNRDKRNIPDVPLFHQVSEDCIPVRLIYWKLVVVIVQVLKAWLFPRLHAPVQID